MRHMIIALALACLACPAGAENPFFAFDNIAARGPESLSRKLDELKTLGFDGLSWSGTDVAQVRSVIRAAEERGLKLATLYVGFPLSKEKLAVPENLDEIVKALAPHGTILWVHIQSRDYKPSDAAADAVVVAALQDVADRAGRSNLKIALYPHAGFWVETVSDSLRVARKVNRPNLGISFNLCHALKTGDEANVIPLIEQAGPQLFVVSLNGADAGLGRQGNWDRLIQPLGRGTYDIRPVLRQLKSQGFTGPVGFQGYAIAGDRREILEQTIASWRQLTARR